MRWASALGRWTHCHSLARPRILGQGLLQYIHPYVRAGKCWPAQHTLLLPVTSIWFPSYRVREKLCLIALPSFPNTSQKHPETAVSTATPIFPNPLKQAGEHRWMHVNGGAIPSIALWGILASPVQRRAMPR